ncbi:MAG: DinB family protein [Chloroflexi bacterium]|nr:DinB family protein [Chloroflexota bacterium]
MTVVEFIQRSINELNNTIIDDVKELTPAQLQWKPAPRANPIGFIFWHFMRSQDVFIAGLRGKPSVWESEKWFEKLGMDATAQGTGFQEPDVSKVALLPLSETMAYAGRVALSTEDYLRSLTDARLEDITDPARPRRTTAIVLRSFIIAHGWWHIGEIRYVKGMQGMPAFR